MLRVYTCLAEEHDLRLVVVAGLICFLAAFTTFLMVEQARRGSGRRAAWLVAAGFVCGTGIWSTHFLAMLAYEPNLPIGYDAGLTLLSIVAAMTIGGLGWWVSILQQRWAPLAAGAVIGVGIGTMHYTGMSAVDMAGRFVWDTNLVVASVAIGIAFSALAVHVRRRRVARDPYIYPWPAAALFTVAICGLHFTAMGAAQVLPDPSMAVPETAIGTTTLGMIVTTMATVILAISFATVLFNRKLDRRAAEEARRLRTFADAAIEGLVVIDGDRI